MFQLLPTLSARRVLIASLLIEASTIEAFHELRSINTRASFALWGSPPEKTTEDPPSWPLIASPAAEESIKESPRWITFLEKELEWGRQVRNGLLPKIGLAEDGAPQETLVEAQQRFATFLRNELEWGAQVRAGLATLEQERAKQRLDEAAAFLEENKRHNAIMQAAASSVIKNVGAVRTESERAVLDMTAPFWDKELGRVFPTLSVCTDGLACGQHGGFELLEAISAYKYAMPGLSNVAVRSGPCEGVCPRDKCTVALRCPGQRLRTVKAVPAGSVVAALTAQEQAVDQQSVKREAAFSDALLGSGSGSTEAPSNLSAQSQFSPQSTAPAMLFEGSIDDDSNDNNGNDLEALSAKLIAQKLSNILGTSIGADADQDAPSAADWSDAMSWSEAAAKLVFAECGTMVPPLLVVAHQAKHFGDLAAKQTNFRDAEKLYNLAIEHCPTRVFEPAWETEEEETARRALRSLAGSLWVESRHNSLLTLVIKDDFLVESFRESSGSYCRGSAALIDVSVEADGLLKGTWMEGSGSGSFQLQVKPDGRAFSGARYNQAGQLADLWHGTRILASGSPAVPPKLGVAWLVGALVGRAKARLEIFLTTTSEHAAKSAVGVSNPSRLLAGVVSDCSVARSLCPFSAEPVAVLAAALEEQRSLVEAINAYEDLLFLEPPAPWVDLADIESLRLRSLDGAVAAVALSDALTGDESLRFRVKGRQRRLADLRELAHDRVAMDQTKGSARGVLENQRLSLSGFNESEWQAKWSSQIESTHFLWRL